MFQKQLSEVFYKKGILKNFAKFTGKHLCQILLFNKASAFFTEHPWTTTHVFVFLFVFFFAKVSFTNNF